MAKSIRLWSLPPVLAALGLALPVQAAPNPRAALPVTSQLTVLRDAGQAHGWDRGRYRDRYRHGRHHGGLDLGDVITGILVIGGAVAVASAISDNADDDPRPYPDRYPYPYPREANSYPDDRYASDRVHDGQTEMARAIDRCIADVEREERIATVDVASRVLNGWTVEGALRGGGLYRCEIDSFGNIRDVTIDGRELSSWNDEARQTPPYERDEGDYYARARARQGMSSPDPRSPHLGPSDREAGDGDAQDWQRGQADDRYDASGEAVVASAR